MRERGVRASGHAGDPPEFWTQSASGTGGTLLTYAVRGGKARIVLGALGWISLLSGAWFAYWMLSEGEITVAGAILLLLVSGSLVAFGAHCLDIVFRARTEYVMNSHGLIATRYCLWGNKRTEIARSAVLGVAQHYSPPGPSSPSGSPGTWATVVGYRSTKRGRDDELALDGQGSPEEARWLGPLLAKWADKPLRRGFGAEFDEADPADLPSLDG